MKKYLVTGGEGFIGTKIAEQSRGQSYDLKSGRDILNEADLLKASFGAAGIFHCAAKISVPESIEKPDEYYRNNVEGTRSVIEVARKMNASIVFSSSAAVYGDSGVAVDEDAALNPKTPYAENKKDGERLLRASLVSSVALRYFNVYGPGQSTEYAAVITSFILQALQGKDIIIQGDGQQVRDFIFVDDVVRANMMAMDRAGEFEIYNVGSGTETTINQLAEMVINLTGSPSRILHGPARVGDIVYSQANISKIKKGLGWVPTVSLEEGLKKTVEYYRSIALVL